MVHNGSKYLQKNAIKGATKIWVQNGATKIRVQKSINGSNKYRCKLVQNIFKGANRIRIYTFFMTSP